MCRQKEINRSLDKLIIGNFGKPFEQLVTDLPVELLLEMGKRVCPFDYVVRFYDNEKHKKLYHNEKELRRAIRRVWRVGAFNHKQNLYDILERRFFSI